jgi:hypothetical protein
MCFPKNNALLRWLYLAPRWHITRPSKRKVYEVSSCSRPPFHMFASDSWPSITRSRVIHNLDASTHSRHEMGNPERVETLVVSADLRRRS